MPDSEQRKPSEQTARLEAATSEPNRPLHEVETIAQNEMLWLSRRLDTLAAEVGRVREYADACARYTATLDDHPAQAAARAYLSPPAQAGESEWPKWTVGASGMIRRYASETAYECWTPSGGFTGAREVQKVSETMSVCIADGTETLTTHAQAAALIPAVLERYPLPNLEGVITPSSRAVVEAAHSSKPTESWPEDVAEVHQRGSTLFIKYDGGYWRWRPVGSRMTGQVCSGPEMGAELIYTRPSKPEGGEDDQKLADYIVRAQRDEAREQVKQLDSDLTRERERAEKAEAASANYREAMNNLTQVSLELTAERDALKAENAKLEKQNEKLLRREQLLTDAFRSIT